MSTGTLHAAIDQKDINEVIDILRAGVNVNSVHRQQTALTKAIRLQADDITNAILGHPFCCVNAVDQFDRSPLYHAALDGQKSLVEKLLEAGCDVNCCDVGGESPLSAAAFYDQGPVAEVLIKAGAVIDVKNRRGETALYRACSQLSVDVVSILIRNGSDINIKTSEGRTPLKAAILADNQSASRKLKQVMIIDLLLEFKAQLDCQDYRQFSALHHAVDRNDIYSTCSLLASGCNMELRNEDGMTPFDIAVSREKQYFYLATLFFLYGFILKASHAYETIAILLFKNKYLETNKADRNRLFTIVLNETTMVPCCDDIVSKIDNSENIDDDCLNKLALHAKYSIPKSLKHICRVIIRSNIQNNFYNNLKQLDLPSNLKVYLSYGIDTFFSPLDVWRMFLAIESGENADVRRYIEIGMNKDVAMHEMTPLMAAAYYDNVEAVTYFLSIKANCDTTNSDGDAAIHLAARLGRTAIVMLLANCHTCLNIKNCAGNKAFNEAIIHNNSECALHLINFCSKTDINFPDQKGIPPLHYAVGNGNLEVTSILLSKGACVNKVDSEGNTALHVAATKGTIYLRKNIELPGLFSSKVTCALTTASVMMCDVSGISLICKKLFDLDIHNNITTLLINAGGDVNISNSNRKTASDLACDYGFHNS